jgi:hypothetical protein
MKTVSLILLLTCSPIAVHAQSLFSHPLLDLADVSGSSLWKKLLPRAPRDGTFTMSLRSQQAGLTPQEPIRIADSPAPGVRGVAQSVCVGCRFRFPDELSPLRSSPSHSPALHFQHRVCVRHAAVRRGARPSLRFRCRQLSVRHRPANEWDPYPPIPTPQLKIPPSLTQRPPRPRPDNKWMPDPDTN